MVGYVDCGVCVCDGCGHVDSVPPKPYRNGLIDGKLTDCVQAQVSGAALELVKCCGQFDASFATQFLALFQVVNVHFVSPPLPVHIQMS